MSLFTQSAKAVTAALREIADTVGASGEPEMIVRASRSLQAAVEHFNVKANWEFMLAEATPIAVVAPFGITITASAGQLSASATSHSLQVDDLLVGSGFAIGTRVTATGAGGFGFSRAITGFTAGLAQVSTTAHRDRYSLPANYKAIYTARMLSDQRTLRPIRRRLWDRSTTDEFETGIPEYYDIFGIGGGGRIGLLPLPNRGDTLQIRYYQRMSVVTASASGTNTLIDIPQDYEPYLIAFAKWHFLIDKDEGQRDRASVWLNFANEGMIRMQSDQSRIPDEDLGFIPGHYGMGIGVNTLPPRAPW